MFEPASHGQIIEIGSRSFIAFPSSCHCCGNIPDAMVSAESSVVGIPTSQSSKMSDAQQNFNTMTCSSSHLSACEEELLFQC